MRFEIDWRGQPPDAALGGALSAAGVDIVPGCAGPFVVCGPGGRAAAPTVAAPDPAGPPRDWLWLCRGPLTQEQRLDAVQRGAYDAISLSDPDAAEQIVLRLVELGTPEPAPRFDGRLALVSDAARRVVQQVARAAQTSMPVLFTGETGTGKEVMARLTHAWSARHLKPFVPINCAAIPNDLMEAELFGYARGAFSGAIQKYDGQLMAAEGGTVFIDEIDDTPPETQTKLLRVLEDRVVSRLGENVWHEVDFRLLAATNRDLHPLIDAGLFGADLYERLAIVTVRLVPLRERIEDLPILAAHFVERFAREQLRPPVQAIRPEVIRALQAYPWPGNIRELRNVLYETLVYKRAGTQLLLSDLPTRILSRAADLGSVPLTDRSAVASRIARGTMNLREEVAALERAAVEEALRRAGGNAAQAAQLLGQVGRGVARDPGGTVRAMMRRLKR